MTRLIISGILLCLPVSLSAQDLTWLVEQSPAITATWAKLLGKAPSFTAKVQVQVTGKTDPGTSSASGTLEFKEGNLRWEARLSNIASTQLSPQARSIVRQINGEQFLLLTRPDQGTNYLVLAGVQACLAEALPAVKLNPMKGSGGQESIDGYSCQKHKMSVTSSDQQTNEVFVWKSKDLKNIPIRVKILEKDQEFRIDLQDVHFRAVAADRFQVPRDLTRYNSMEDLVQSVLLAKMKRRMGLE